MSDRGSTDIQSQLSKLLTQINTDVKLLKEELKSVHVLIEKNASLPITIKTVNEKLKIVAKEAGINLDDLENVNSDDEEMEQEVNNSVVSESERLNNQQTLPIEDEHSNASSTKKITKTLLSILQ